MEALIDALGSAVIAVARDGTIAHANPAARALLGELPTSADALELRAPDRVTPLADSPLARALVGEPARADAWIRGHHVELVATPTPDGAVLVLHDIQRYHQNARFLEAIIDNVPNMVFVKEEPSGRFIRFNRAGKELLGLDPSVDLTGKTDYDLSPREQADFFRRQDAEAIARGITVENQEPLQSAAGERILWTRKVPIHDENGNLSWLLGISEDITERRANQEELEAQVVARTEALRRSEAQLRQAQKMEAIGRLAGGVAHDFNNMLTAIMTHAQLLARDPSLGKGVQLGLSQILEAGERAAALTRKLLSFSRQNVLQPEPLDVGVVATGMQPMLERLIGEDIQLRIWVAQELRAVVADPVAMEQVVLNLVVNARDAMPRGGALTIDIRGVNLEHPLQDLAAGEYVRLAVTDTGIGMGPETLARLFEPFFTTKPIGTGTGLGLSTTLGIVQQSGGDVVVTSSPGDGSTFAVYLPVSPGTAPRQRKRTVTPIHVGAGTILLVEDEDLVRRAMTQILESAGYDVLTAASPAAALEICKTFTNRIDLLVSDMVMPGMRGRELAIEARAILPHLKVLFVSGYTGQGATTGATEGAFLAKPFTPDELTGKVRGVIKQ